jgi:hypothetical protein
MVELLLLVVRETGNGTDIMLLYNNEMERAEMK